MIKKKIIIRNLGTQFYEPVYHAMCNFTKARNEYTLDEIWLVEHFPVFTKGKRKTEKSINLIKSIENIPVVNINRGGDITYHGPGQQIIYALLNLKNWKMNARVLLSTLEQTVVNTLIEYNIQSNTFSYAPGIYVKKKICSIGLHIQRGCSLHGIALNVNMDLSPFLYINPCGKIGMKMTQIKSWNHTISLNVVRLSLVKNLLILLNNPQYEYIEDVKLLRNKMGEN